MAVFCQYCGSGLPLSAHFCSSCGASVPQAQPISGRMLIRPRAGRVIGGVCKALANAYGWDVTAVRILTILGVVVTSGLLGVAYLAAWIGIPEETPPLAGAYPRGR